MIIKILGAFIIVASCTLIGICIKYHHTLHIRELENFSDCLDVINSEMSLSLRNISEVLKKASEYASEYNYIFFSELTDKAKTSDGEALSLIWNNTLDKTPLLKSIYNRDDINAFKSFGNLLGTGDSEIQKSNIENFKNTIKERINIAKDKSNKIFVLGKLGIYFGIIIVILLI